MIEVNIGGITGQEYRKYRIGTYIFTFGVVEGAVRTDPDPENLAIMN